MQVVKQAGFTQGKAITGCRSDGAYKKKTAKAPCPKTFWVIYEP